MLAVAALLIIPGLTISLFVIRNIGRLDHAKTEFISLTSHQLRTPPTGIKWYAGMLLEGDLGEMTPPQRKYLEQIVYNNQRMIDVVDSVLDISQIELGVFQNEPVLTDVCMLIEKILAELDFQLNDKELTLSRRLECGPQPILIDPTLVRIVMQNLLVNAVKYTPRGGEIAFMANVTNAKLTLTIADTGYGIPKKDIPYIFKKFFRASNSHDAGYSGTGLGLYIVGRILDQIGGEISFKSELGRGTTFFVSIPLRAHPLIT
jgi:signal transduction histidine kinase